MSPDLICTSSQNGQNYITLINLIEQRFFNRCFWQNQRSTISAKYGSTPVLIGLRTNALENCSVKIPLGINIMLFAFRPPRGSWHEGLCMNTSIHYFRVNCTACSSMAPSQPQEPITITVFSDWPFQQYLFFIELFANLVCAYRLHDWLILYHLKPGHATTFKLISICWGLFHIYGTPQELSCDEGPHFTSRLFQQFLKTWHIRSSVEYTQSNGRAIKNT